MYSKSTHRSLRRPNRRRLAFEPLEARRLLSTYVVNTTADTVNPFDGELSLREAITNANVNPGADNIFFDIPGTGVQTITPLTPLPSITGATNIDATTQPGFAGSPIIEISGAAITAGTARGLTITGAGSTIRGFIINSFRNQGILVTGAGAANNVIVGNWVGLDATGTIADGNGTAGGLQNILVTVAGAGNRIGGTAVADRNVVAGGVISSTVLNDGIVIERTNGVIVQGNYVGTNADGTAALPNNLGILLRSGSNGCIIGGTADGAGNLVSGNRSNGIALLGSATLGPTTNNLVHGNYVGTMAGGTGALGNGGIGINVSALANNNTVGGTSLAAQNVVCYNVGGMSLAGSGNVVEGNSIGVDADGSAAGNSSRGINITGSNNLIGGSAAGAGNVIAFSAAAGIGVTTGTGNRISRNSIFSNGGLGIDLRLPDGPNPNDPQDPDVGGNRLQNYPVITSVITTGSSTIIEGTLNSTPFSTFTIEFFRNLMADPSGFGEGQTFIGDTTVITDGDGNASFIVVFAGVPAGEVMTATATDAAGNTSEFSGATTVEPPPPGSIFLIPDACHPGETALIVNGTPMDDDIHIAPSGGGVEVTLNDVSQGTYQPTGRIIVYGYAGNDSIQLAGAVPNEAWLYGDSGDDQLNLGNGGGIAFGGDGNDHLLGGSARDILVGGDGADRLVGNSGDDIMIAAMSIYDDRFVSPDHEAAWCAIHHEWKRTDHTYEQRVDNIRDGTGTPLDRENGLFFLNSTTVLDDDDEDTLTGASARDWFFANLDGFGTHDKITDLKSDEFAEELVP